MSKGKVLLIAAGLIGIYLMTRKTWVPPQSATPYLADIAAAERQYDMPKNLMARLLYQESHYRQDIITGQVESSAGAQGIAQIVPRWHPDVDPLNPTAAIHYAAGYLSRLKNQFGDWETALAAYNWGPGNVSNAREDYGYEWLNYAPEETKNYVREIWGDVA